MKESEIDIFAKYYEDFLEKFRDIEKEVYNNALQNPDEIISAVDKNGNCEEILGEIFLCAKVAYHVKKFVNDDEKLDYSLIEKVKSTVRGYSKFFEEIEELIDIKNTKTLVLFERKK
jgi:shikimate kinase